MKKYCLIIVCAVLFASCTAFVDSAEDYYYLSEPIKRLLPYRLGEEVRFTSGSGDLITLTVERVEDTWWWYTEREWKSWIECRNMQLRSKTGPEGIDLELEEWLYFSHTPCINLVFRPLDQKVTIKFDLEGNLTTPKEDSVLIGGRMYHDVAKTQAFYRRAMNNKIDTLHCYYSKSQGVLQVKENNKVFLERLP